MKPHPYWCAEGGRARTALHRLYSEGQTMGVPAFYRWLSEKYPKIVVDVLEDQPVRVEGTEIPLDLTAKNPNGIEVTQLCRYLRRSIVGKLVLFSLLYEF